MMSVPPDLSVGNETVKTIAARLGISHSTVSRALNPAKRHLVATYTRSQIEILARELRYRPSGIARSLRDNRSGLLGFYTSGGYGLDGEFALTILITLQNTCERLRQHLLLLSGSLSQTKVPSEETFAAIWNSKIDGLILQSTSDDPLICHLRDSTLPLVAISDAPDGIPIVRPDDAGGTTALLQYLWEQGRRRIAFLTTDVPLPSAKRRCAAYEAFCREYGIRPDVLAIPLLDYEELLRRIAQQPASERPDTFFCFCDMLAYSLRRTLRKEGLRVPEDIAVAGFDGFTNYKSDELVLTGVVVPWREIAATAAQLLMRRISGETIPEETIVATRLQIGNTA